MVIPASVNGYFIAQTFGTMIFYFIFVVIGTILWLLLFGVGYVITGSILIILSTIVIVILGLLFMIQLNFFLGMLAFKFQDIEFFLIIKSNIVSFVTGGLIPLMLLPQGIVLIMKFFPFYYVTYLPAMLLIGKNQKEAVTGIITLSIWLFVFVLLNKKTYNKMRIIYDGVGI
jgi:ABC-2 type transport system permease protein